MSSNRNLSIAVISILILSAFTTVQLSLAEVTPAPPFITVNPSSVRPGQTVKVEGWNFPEGKTLDIYCDGPHNYHYLGSVTTNPGELGYSFTLSFVMQNGYPGVHEIKAYDADNLIYYTADFILIKADPLDQRLVDIIKGLSVEVEAIEAKLDSGGSFYEFVNVWFTTIQTAISNLGIQLAAKIDAAVTDITLAISNAKTDIITEIDDNEVKLDNIWGKVDTEIGAIKAKTDTINWADINNIGNWLNGWFGSEGTYSKTEQIDAGGGHWYFTTNYAVIIYDSGDKPAKMTLTINTVDIGTEEYLGLRYGVGETMNLKANVEEIAFEMDINPAKTFEFCFQGDVRLECAPESEWPEPDYHVWYNYVVEYQPFEYEP